MKPNTETQTESPMQLYFRDLRKYKLLEREQEVELAQRYRQYDDPEAFRQLIKANLRLVVKIARGFFTDNGVSLTDLIQEGNLGLIQAARKYDPGKNVKFSYYAGFWIRAFIYKYLMDNYRSVRIGTTQSQRKLFYNLKKISRQLRLEGIEPTPESIAERLNVPRKDVIEMQQRLQVPDISLNSRTPGREHEEKIDNLISTSLSIDEMLENHELKMLLRQNTSRFKKQLDDREKEVIEKRILSPRPETLATLGDRYGVSRERIRQIEVRIIEKLRDYLLKELPHIEGYLSN